MSDAKNVILVTGASSGIGRAAAARFAAAGDRVFGASRQRAAPDGVESVSLDLRDDASVAACVDEVLSKAGRIDVLVNNGGYTIIGAIEETSVEQARALFDTNFFGAVRMTAAVLPHMRARRSGRVVNISSVLGFLPAPYMGFYGASKHALEGWSTTLDHEVRTRGVRVVLVQPAFTRTGIGQHAQRGDRELADYDGQRARVTGGIDAQVAASMAPEEVAETIFRAARSASSRTVWLAGGAAKKLGLLSSLVPNGAFQVALRKQFRLD